MPSTDPLARLRRGAARHAFEDGAIDVALGLFTVMVGAATQRRVWLALAVVYFPRIARMTRGMLRSQFRRECWSSGANTRIRGSMIAGAAILHSWRPRRMGSLWKSGWTGGPPRIGSLVPILESESTLSVCSSGLRLSLQNWPPRRAIDGVTGIWPLLSRENTGSAPQFFPFSWQASRFHASERLDPDGAAIG